MPSAPERLPVDDHLDAVRAHLARHRALVLTAAPGAGKTTRVPPALVDQGPLLLLQPRRVAARAIAQRIAFERGWTLGREIGWQIRFERRFTDDTRLLLVTEGILTARLQQDPLLSGFRTIVLDEFHERSLHADLGLALARQAWLARDDLRILVMSATLDAEPVSAFLGGCPIVEVPGRRHPLTIDYAPGRGVADVVREVVPETSGQVLCFLPGAGDITRAAADLTPHASTLGVEVLPLHGSLDGDAQDAAIRPSRTRRVILATNIAETSLTVPGVHVVIDTGQHKVARYEADRGVDSLVTERVTEDSANQRAGRAGRLGPGRVWRLWDARDRLRPHREPEIARVDLAGAVLSILAWGGDPRAFEWFEAPAVDRIDTAMALLDRLGATDGSGGISTLGRSIQRLPLHPRLGAILIDGGAAPDVAAACALLAEGVSVDTGGTTTTCDLLAALDRWSHLAVHVRRVAGELERLGRTILSDAARTGRDERALRHALFRGYADRLARRRSPGRYTLASGHGATLGRESGVGDAELIVALDVVAARQGERAEARIRLASRVEPEWVSPTGEAIEHRLDPRSGVVKAFRVRRYEALVLDEQPARPDPAQAARLVARAWHERPHDERTTQLLARLRFSGIAANLDELVAQAAASATSVDAIDLASHLPWDVARDLDRLAPESLAVPSGRQARLEYGEDGTVEAAVKLQELFGLAETPRIGPRRTPVVFQLLAPNGRPVQKTSDLRSFWERTYPEVRKELRGRYPKHPWPEDPWTAPATHRARSRTPPPSPAR